MSTETCEPWYVDATKGGLQKRCILTVFYQKESCSMTGLKNKRAYDEKLSWLAKNAPAEFCIVSADLNGLKKANDAIGHRAGDELITGAAECLSGAFEGIDRRRR